MSAGQQTLIGDGIELHLHETGGRGGVRFEAHARTATAAYAVVQVLIDRYEVVEHTLPRPVENGWVVRGVVR